HWRNASPAGTQRAERPTELSCSAGRSRPTFPPHATRSRSTRRPNASPWWPSWRGATPTPASCSPAAAPRSSTPTARRLPRPGVPRTRIALEDHSRNTVENAVLSKAIAQPKPGERWLLVTSAHHLPRAVGVFRKAGFPVEAYPVDWRTRGAEDALRPFASVGDG